MQHLCHMYEGHISLSSYVTCSSAGSIFTSLCAAVLLTPALAEATQQRDAAHNSHKCLLRQLLVASSLPLPSRECPRVSGPSEYLVRYQCSQVFVYQLALCHAAPRFVSHRFHAVCCLVLQHCIASMLFNLELCLPEQAMVSC